MNLYLGLVESPESSDDKSTVPSSVSHLHGSAEELHVTLLTPFVQKTAVSANTNKHLFLCSILVVFFVLCLY